jgi:predicted Zn-dependent protease with MMP-like domain
MERIQFDKCIEKALSSIPKEIRKRIENVAFLVEDEAREPLLQEHGIKIRNILLGLYEGIPFTRRGTNYSMVLPDRITLFKSTIEEAANNENQKVQQLIREVVLHEVAHYFGFNESEVRTMEQKRRAKNKLTD